MLGGGKKTNSPTSVNLQLCLGIVVADRKFLAKYELLTLQSCAVGMGGISWSSQVITWSSV